VIQILAFLGWIVVGLWWAYKPYEGISEGRRKRLHEIRDHAYTIDPGMRLAREKITALP